MKRVIQGRSYDTDTATKVTGGDNGSYSDAWWGLYRTQQGAFFKVVVNHDGETILEFKPLTDAEAQTDLEKHENGLVEQYFGPMPDASPMRFSRRSVISAVEVIEAVIGTHADLTRCLLKWSPPLNAACDAATLKGRFNQLMNFFDNQPGHRVVDGNLLGEEIVEKAVSLLPSIAETEPWSQFLRTLDHDGFTVTDGVLRRSLPDRLKLPEAEDEILRLLGKHGLNVAKGHLDQAVTAHTAGDCASANAQIRTFFDAVIDGIAERIDPSAVGLESGNPHRTKLAAKNFFFRNLHEWDDNGKGGFINGLVKRLHPEGSHPGLSDQEDSTFRLHTVLLTARLLLARFDTWGIR